MTESHILFYLSAYMFTHIHINHEFIKEIYLNNLLFKYIYRPHPTHMMMKTETGNLFLQTS